MLVVLFVSALTALPLVAGTKCAEADAILRNLAKPVLTIDIRKDCGAKGDGVCNDTAAFQKAAALLQAARGGRLVIPKGVYVVGAQAHEAGSYPYYKNKAVFQFDGMPASVVRMRQPQWADAVTAVAADGSAVPLIVKNGYCATKKPVKSVEFVYAGGVYAEGRRCNCLPKGPVDGQPFALGFGPKLFAAANQSITLPAWPATVEALKAQGVELFSSALRGKDYRFVFDR